MAIPQFSAEASLYRTSGQYRMVYSVEGAPGVEAARMRPEYCYWRDSRCTQFCGKVKDQYWRYECFSLCDKYLDNCLSRGVWTDRAARFE